MTTITSSATRLSPTATTGHAVPRSHVMSPAASLASSHSGTTVTLSPRKSDVELDTPRDSRETTMMWSEGGDGDGRKVNHPVGGAKGQRAWSTTDEHRSFGVVTHPRRLELARLLKDRHGRDQSGMCLLEQPRVVRHRIVADMWHIAAAMHTHDKDDESSEEVEEEEDGFGEEMKVTLGGTAIKGDLGKVGKVGKVGGVNLTEARGVRYMARYYIGTVPAGSTPVPATPPATKEKKEKRSTPSAVLPAVPPPRLGTRR